MKKFMKTKTREVMKTMVIKAGKAELQGDLFVPEEAKGIVVFAHGTGSSRLSPRNRYVADQLNKAKLATLLFDLLTEQEEIADMQTGEFRFNLEFLCERLVAATESAKKDNLTRGLPLGYFGASTGAAAALMAAIEFPVDVKAVVARGGRPDLAEAWLSLVKAPTLLIVGSLDTVVIGMNRRAFEQLQTTKKMMLVPGASHLFEEPGTLEKVALLARDWFLEHL